METSRKIPEFDISPENFEDFLQNRKQIFIKEYISAAEEIVYLNKDSAVVCKLKVSLKDKLFILNTKLTVQDLFEDLQPLLDLTIEMEEYELSHKLKLLIDYIKENDIRRKVEETIRGNKEAEKGSQKATRPIWN